MAIDGSPQSDKAAEEAVRLAAGNQSQFKSRIYALLVLPNAPTSTYTDFVPAAPMTETKNGMSFENEYFMLSKNAQLNTIFRLR